MAAFRLRRSGSTLRGTHTLRSLSELAGTVGLDLSLPWSVRSTVGDSLEGRWQVKQVAGDTFTPQWAVRAPAGDQLVLVWSFEGGGTLIIMRASLVPDGHHAVLLPGSPT